jgi:hypothetical protein
MRLAIKRLARVASITAAIVASFDSSVMAQPLFAKLGEVASRLTAGFSEVEEVRRKIRPTRKILGAAFKLAPALCLAQRSAVTSARLS